MRNNVSLELLYINNYSSSFGLPSRESRPIASPLLRRVNRESEYQCWIQTPELLRSSGRHFRRRRREAGDLHSSMQDMLPLSAGHGEVVFGIFATHCVCIIFAFTLHQGLIYRL